MKSRIYTGLFLLFLGLFLLFLGSTPLMVGLGLILLLFISELSFMYAIPTKQRYLLSAGCLFFFITSLYFPFFLSLLFLLPLFMLLWAGLELLQSKLLFLELRFSRPFRVVLWTLSSVPFLYLLRDSSKGLFQCLFLCGVIWGSDSLAYFFGKYFGKTPLTPISPKKTREGLLGGFLGGAFIALLIGPFLYYSTVYALCLSFFITGIAFLGDLHQSLCKRHFGLKDSGSILPGHGGIYDRIDSFQFVLPLYYFWIR